MLLATTFLALPITGRRTCAQIDTARFSCTRVARVPVREFPQEVFPGAFYTPQTSATVRTWM
jgi:hypothetical protein